MNKERVGMIHSPSRLYHNYVAELVGGQSVTIRCILGQNDMWRVGDLFEIWDDAIMWRGPMTPSEAFLAAEITAKFLEFREEEIELERLLHETDPAVLAKQGAELLDAASAKLCVCDDDDDQEMEL